jgi:cytoskeletal protein CcmA (bactofilin family)
MAGSNEDAFQSHIGKGTKVSGKLNFKAPTLIEGEAEGEITGDDIVIAQGALVTARIAASKITIAGTVNGEVSAREKVEIMSSARLKCTITTPSLVFHEGATLDGDCKMPGHRAAA